jgi:hypothetical protein
MVYYDFNLTMLDTCDNYDMIFSDYDGILMTI